MKDTDNASQTEDEGDLFSRLRALETTAIPDRVRHLATSYGKTFTNLCIQPYELLTEDPFNSLSPERQGHARSCFLCALVVGDAASIRTLFPPEAVAAAAAAALQAKNREIVPRPVRPRLYRAIWNSFMERLHSFTAVIARQTWGRRLAEAARSLVRLRFPFRPKPEREVESASAGPTQIT